MTLAARPARTRSRSRLIGWLALITFGVLLSNVLIEGAKKAPDNKMVTLSFVDRLRPLVLDSNSHAAELSRIRAGFSRQEGRDKAVIDSGSLQKRLNKLRSDVTATSNAALAIPAPNEIRGMASLSWASFSLRSRAVDSIAASLEAVLANKENEARSELQTVNNELATSDAIYAQFKLQLETDDVQAELPDSQWLPDPSSWKDDDAKFLIASWKSNLSSSAIHNLAIVSVLTDPTAVRTAIDKSPIQILPSQKNMNITVVVGNLGNTREENIPIRVTVNASDGSSDGKNDAVSLAPGGKVTITFRNIRVVPDGLSTVTIQLGPAGSEADESDNSNTFVFTMNPTTAVTTSSAPVTTTAN